MCKGLVKSGDNPSHFPQLCICYTQLVAGTVNNVCEEIIAPKLQWQNIVGYNYYYSNDLLSRILPGFEIANFDSD